MKRAIAGAVFIALAAAASASAPPEAPLDRLCRLICRGTWVPAAPPAPDQFVTTYRYEWDEKLGGIRGVATTTGGVGGVHEEMIVVFGEDATRNHPWTLRVRGKGAPVYGTVTVSNDGYMEKLAPLGDDTSYMIANYRFTGNDEYEVRTEIVTPDQSVLGQPAVFKRSWD